MLKTAHELDLLTVGYAFNEVDTRRLMLDAAPDIFIFHAGITAGGSTGFARGRSLADTARVSQQHFEIAQNIKPDVILLSHGAAIVNPEDAQFMLDHTMCHGVQLGSSIERMAIEEPLIARARSFKDVHFSPQRRVD
jgi:predicted TIM-barrel enzyme